MKTDKEINATNQLIKVIRGEVSSLPLEHRQAEAVMGVPESSDERPRPFLKYIVFTVLIALMIAFTVLSVTYLSGEIKKFEIQRDMLFRSRMDLEALKIDDALYEQQNVMVKRIDSVAHLLTRQGPYVSSLIKEIAEVIPKNCYINRLQLLMPAYNDSGSKAAVSIEGTLVENPQIIGVDLFTVTRSIDESPVFTMPKIGYQDRSNLSNYRTIEFQIGFGLE